MKSKAQRTYDQSLCWSCWVDNHTDHKAKGCPCKQCAKKVNE